MSDSNRVRGHQFVDEHGLVMADAVCPVAGLIFHGRIPPGVVVNNRIGGGQVQPGSTCRVQHNPLRLQLASRNPINPAKLAVTRQPLK